LSSSYCSDFIVSFEEEEERERARQESEEVESEGESEKYSNADIEDVISVNDNIIEGALKGREIDEKVLGKKVNVPEV